MFAAIVLSAQVALGVGAVDSNKILVRIDGKETAITLAGVSGGSERGLAFAQCLVANRVVRVSGPHSAAKVTMLDDSSVAGHVAEFLQTQTSSDPCALGKAAYQARVLARAATPAPAKPAAAAKKPVREIHVSFAGGEDSKDARKVPPAPPIPVGANYVPPPPPPAPSNQPVYQAPPTVGTYAPPTVGTYAPPTGSTSSSLQQGGTQQGLQQQGTQQMPQQGTQPVPTTTYSPPPM